jgi:hypothetical protein
MVGRFEGSFCKVLVIMSFKDWETAKLSGNEKTPDFIFL